MPPEHPILAFDTAAAHCAAAVVWGGRLIAARHEEMQRGQGERLFPMLEELLAEAGISWPELGRIGVGIGPGNFTGIRISVAAARGLALALGIPALGVSRFESFALDLPRPLAVCLDGRAGRIMLQRFTRDGQPAAPSMLEEAEAEACLKAMAASDLAITGDDTAMQLARRIGAPCLRPALAPAEAIARIAAARPARGASPPSPLYLRPADAAPPRDRAPRLL